MTRWPTRRASAGVPEAQIRQLAEWYHTLSPAAISVGNGLERNQNGGSGIRAIFALPALAGKFGVPGGGLVNGAGFAFPKTPARLQRPDLRARRARARSTSSTWARTCSIPTLVAAHQGAVHLQPQPASSCTRTRTACAAGLLREDLFVVGLPTW